MGRELRTADLRAPGPHSLYGRLRETEVIDRLVRDLRAGHGTALVLYGEAGIGKTALVANALAGIRGVRVLSVGGTEFEAELPFAALHQMCAPLMSRTMNLPAWQRGALETAFGLNLDGAPDRFLINLAMLGLLSDTARERPLLCVVDDAHWLDTASAQSFAFTARRLESERIAFVFILRDPTTVPLLNGLPTLALEGLNARDAEMLLAAELAGSLDDQVKDRIVAEARGNPLALLELPRRSNPAQLAGGYAVPDTEPLGWQLQESFAQRLAQLPEPTRMLVLVAAAEPVGDPLLLRRAVDILGIDPAAANPAEDAALVDIGTRVRFRHPLVRSVVYRSASSADRRKAHQALSQAVDPATDPDRHAWHRAQAAQGLDEEVAAELERGAQRAQARGGLAAAAAFLERAATLTPDPVRRATRALAAAQTMQQAGFPDRTLDLLRRAEAGPLSSHQRAGAELLRAQLTLYATRGRGALQMLLDAARNLDPERARETYLEAYAAARWAGRLGPQESMPTVAEAYRTATAALAAEQSPIALLLEALTVQISAGHVAAVPHMRRAVDAFVTAGPGPAESRWLWLAAGMATDLWDDRSWQLLGERQIEVSRQTGALAVLPLALAMRSLAYVHVGDFNTASVQIAEGYAISQASASAGHMYVEVTLEAWRGNHTRVSALIAEYTPDTVTRGEGRAFTAMDYATAVLHNGLGNHELALAAAQRAFPYDEIGYRAFLPEELVEAAAGVGRPELAAAAIEQLKARAQATGTDWALGAELRARALLTPGPEAGALFKEAVLRLERSGARAHAARARLLHGQWLRRNLRIAEARTELRTAYETLSRIGALGFASRAAAEMDALGEDVAPRDTTAVDALTAQELLIARHVASGSTTKEIAARLFLSPRTIEAHLRSIFRKLQITSRRQLRDIELS